MNGSLRRRAFLACVLAVGGCLWIVMTGASCNTAPTAILVTGPGISGDEPPTLTILEPNADLTRGRGDSFVVAWTDSDRDSNATISFELINTDTNDRILLVEGIEENDLTGPDSFTIGTTFVSLGTYNIRAIIDDGVNLPVTVFAVSSDTNASQRVILTIVEPGQGPQTVPPTITDIKIL